MDYIREYYMMQGLKKNARKAHGNVKRIREINFYITSAEIFAEWNNVAVWENPYYVHGYRVVTKK